MSNYTLAELATETKDGDWGKADAAAGLSLYAIIRGTDFDRVTRGQTADVPRRYLPDRTSARRTLEPGDILLETAGGSPGRPTGRTMLVTRNVLEQFEVPVSCASFARFIRVDRTKADPGFIFWTLRWLYTNGVIESFQVQHTGVARFQYTTFSRSFSFELPPLPEQQAIAEVLGALDDKIAANTRLAATADELASAQFRSLRSVTTRSDAVYDDVAVVGGGGTPSTKTPTYWSGDIPWATPTDITGLTGLVLSQTARTISETGLAACASPLHPTGTILMTSRATIGAFAVAGVPLAVNQGFITVQSRGEIPNLWLLHEMRSRVDEFISWANGATFLELSRGNFRKLPVVTSSPEVMASFAQFAAPLHGTAANAIAENLTLAATRDALLPKLMSGVIRVKDAERLIADPGV